MALAPQGPHWAPHQKLKAGRGYPHLESLSSLTPAVVSVWACLWRQEPSPGLEFSGELAVWGWGWEPFSGSRRTSRTSSLLLRTVQSAGP